MNEKLKQLQEDYERQKKARLEKAKSEPDKGKRFWRVVWYLVSFPFIWVWYNIRDWRTFVIFIICFLLLSCEVWGPLLLGILLNNSDFVKAGLALWAFWALPGTPFLCLCILMTMGVKTVFNKIIKKK